MCGWARCVIQSHIVLLQGPIEILLNVVLWVIHCWLPFHLCMQRTHTAIKLHLKLNLSCMWPVPSSVFFCKTGSKVWMFLLLSSLPVILAAPQQMVWWWCLRSGHVAASSALCPLCRPLPRHPMTNYFPFVTETQSSEGRGVFCRRSYQANLRLFPLVGHSWFDWGLVFKAL